MDSVKISMGDIYATLANYTYEDSDDFSLDVGNVAAPCRSHQISTAFNYIVPVICGVVCLLSLLGNSLVILVISCMRKARSATDVYLLNLAIADFLFAITLPIWVVYQVHEWIFGTTMCKIITLLKEVNFYSGILLLVCISIDRFLAIVYATRTTILKRQWVRYVCVGIWVFSFLLAFPLICFREAFLNNSNASDPRFVCYEKIEGNKTNEWRVRLRILPHTFGFIIPLVIMLICYGVTIHRLLQTKNSQRQKAMKVIIAVVIVFLICWLPYNISLLVDTLLRSGTIADSCERRYKIDAAIASTEIVGFVHCCVNPIIYAFIGQKFRNEFFKMLVEQGIISKEVQIRFRKGSSYSTSSGNTSTTL